MQDQDTEARYTYGITETLVAREELLDFLDETEANSTDYYITIRNLYRQRRIDEMQMFIVAKFTCGFDEWKSIYDGDHDLRKQFMKDDVVGKVSENCAMIKFTVTDPEKMNQVMSKRIPEIAPSIGLEHEIYTLTPVE